MSIFLDPTGRSTYGIAICGRCSRKMFLDQLFPDPNSPGLMVCREDLDDYDPYRLSPPPADPVALPFVRPDVSLTELPVEQVISVLDGTWVLDGSRLLDGQI